MDCRRSDDEAPTTCLEKHDFQMSRWIVSKCEDQATPDPCETSKCDVEQADPTTWVVQEGHPPQEKKGWQTILSDAKEEIPESWRGSEGSKLLIQSDLEQRMEGRYKRSDSYNCAERR